MSTKQPSLHRTIFLSILLGAVVGVVVNKLMDGWPRALADGENASGKRQFTEQAETFRLAAKQIAPSVVAITSLKKVQKLEGFTVEKRRDMLGYLRYYRLPKYAESMEPAGIGSGFIFDDKNGYILTNNHVVQEAEECIVKLHDKRELPAKVVGTDPQTDLAVLKIEAEKLNSAVLGDSDQVAVGDWVLAAGNPFGLLEQTITAGIISAKGRRNLHLNNYEDFLQTDAAINQGNSGGPLVNLSGEVIGINTAIFSKTGGYQGIGFAIPTNMARPIMDALIKDGRVSRGWLGVTLAPLDADAAARARLGAARGVLVAQVGDDTPAARAGFTPGDVILAIDGAEVRDVGRLRNAVAIKGAGQTATFDVHRDGKVKQVKVRLGALPETQPARRVRVR